MRVCRVSYKFTGVQLKSPTFDITDNTLTINDPNTEGVGSYTLNLYRPDGKFILGIDMELNAVGIARLFSGDFIEQLRIRPVTLVIAKGYRRRIVDYWAIVFGVYPEDEQQEIQSVENLKVRVELV